MHFSHMLMTIFVDSLNRHISKNISIRMRMVFYGKKKGIRFSKAFDKTKHKTKLKIGLHLAHHILFKPSLLPKMDFENRNDYAQWQHHILFWFYSEILWEPDGGWLHIIFYHSHSIFPLRFHTTQSACVCDFIWQCILLFYQ